MMSFIKKIGLILTIVLPTIVEGKIFLHNDSLQSVQVRMVCDRPDGSEWPGNGGTYALPARDQASISCEKNGSFEIYNPQTNRKISSSRFSDYSGGHIHYSLDEDGYIYYNKYTNPRYRCPWKNVKLKPNGDPEECKLYEERPIGNFGNIG